MRVGKITGARRNIIQRVSALMFDRVNCISAGLDSNVCGREARPPPTSALST